MIIGLTGSLAAGKEVVSEFLMGKGFAYVSLSGELRELAKSYNIEITRENLQNLGNKLREENGSTFLAQLAVNRIKSNNHKNTIIDSIRNPAEIDYLRVNLNNFYLISVDAPREVRFKRLVNRGRESDPKEWDGFVRVDDRDKGIGEKESGQGVAKCMAMADFTLINDSTIEEVNEKISDLFNEIKSKSSDNLSLNNSRLKIKIKKLHENAVIPAYSRNGDAALDVFAVTKTETENFIEYGTGLAIEMPENYVCLVFPRSSVSNKKLSQANSVGILDSGYRGELKYRFYKHGNEEYDIGDRIGQIMIIPHPKVQFEEVSELSESERGEGGFGSTGK